MLPRGLPTPSPLTALLRESESVRRNPLRTIKDDLYDRLLLEVGHLQQQEEVHRHLFFLRETGPGTRFRKDNLVAETSVQKIVAVLDSEMQVLSPPDRSSACGKVCKTASASGMCAACHATA